MTKMELSYAEKIVQLVRETDTLTNLKEKLEDYHEKDIACALELFEQDERKHVFYALSNEQLAEILPFAKDASGYIQESGISRFAKCSIRRKKSSALSQPQTSSRWLMMRWARTTRN